MKKIQKVIATFFISQLIPIGKSSENSLQILILKRNVSVRWFILLLRVLGYKSIFPATDEEKRTIELIIAEKVQQPNSEIFGLDTRNLTLASLLLLNRARQFQIRIFDEKNAVLNDVKNFVKIIKAHAYIIVTKL